MKLKSSLLTLFAMASFAIGFAQKTVVDIAVESSVHSTLVNALKTADLVETLKGTGPFTVFAPINDAFNKLPVGTLDSLFRPVSKSSLVKILTYHVVAGYLDAAAVVKAIQAANGTAKLKTLSGGTLTAFLANGKVILTDDNGNSSIVLQSDVKAGNGVVHVIDSVLLPK